MRIQKILALLAALAILFSLSSCGWFTKNPDDTTTTTAASPLDPANPGDPPAAAAVMAPLQGGPMLYTFYGSEPYTTRVGEESGDEYPVYPIGLIDQDGKLVSAPVYHNAQYIYDEAGQRVTGLAAVKDREITIYALDGASRVLPVEGYRIEVFPGGRYAIVYTAEDFIWTGGGSREDPLKEGIFDLTKDKYVIEPKEGQMIGYRTGGVALGYQYDTPDGTGNETAQWAFFCADERVLDLPMGLGRIQDYYPETGWFGGMWMEGEWEQRVYDKDLQLIPSLTGWSIDYEGFRGGEWCMIYNNSALPGVTTWVNREGVLSDRRGATNPDAGWQCYLVDGGVLLDSSLNEAASSKNGESLVVLRATGGTDEGFLFLNADGSAKAAYDLAAKPMRPSAGFRCWHDFSYNVAEYGAYILYAAKDGQWTVLELGQFQPKPREKSHEDGVPYANPVVMCEDYIVIETGVHWYEGGPAVYDTFAIDWQGNRLDDCPLEPFFGLLTYQTAGEQGPGYFWIAREDGKRGYINTKGEWLFVDET